MYTRYHSFISRLAGGEVATEENDYVRQNYPRNFIVGVLDAGAYMFGFSFTSLNVIMPLFLSHFTDSQIILGLITGIYEACAALPQLFMVPLVNKQERQIPLVFITGMLPRTVFLLFSALMFFSATLSKDTVVMATLGLLGLFGTTLGFAIAPWQEFIAKTIPLARRGRFFGIRLTFGGILSVVGASFSGWVLSALVFPTNFAVCAFITFIGTTISVILITLSREQTTPRRTSHGAFISPALVRRTLINDRNFAFFVFAIALISLGNMATGFYAVYALDQFAITTAQAGLLNAIWFGASTASNLVWGWITDRLGAKSVMMIGVLTQVTALVLAIVAPTVEIFYIAFALASSAAAATLIGSITLPMMLSPDDQRPLYMGLFSTMRTPTAIAAPLIGGFIARTFSYQAMFAAAAVFALIGTALLFSKVKIKK